MSEPIRIVIADDHPVLRQGLRQSIEKEPNFVVVAEAGNGEQALAEIETQEPAVAVLDVDMPTLNGFQVLRALHERNLSIAVIILTVHQEEEFFNEALRLGAQGYVLKDSAVSDIVAGIRAVAQGKNYVSPSLTSYLFRRSRREEAGAPGLEQLTSTERTILKLIADYKTNNQIAEELCVSAHTVKTHRKNINLKLELEGSHALMRFALEHKAVL